MRNFLKYLIILNLTGMMFSCAQIGVPEGGPQDQTSPAIVLSESDSNYYVNFNKTTIKWTFDEWIELRNPLKEVIISPPLNYIPEYKVKGKTLYFSFNENERLKENVTYQINFGNAITDFTAGNTLDNFVYVFSTGDKIDSLFVEGRVVDETTGEGVEDVIVMLYEDMNDSVLYLQKPFYFTKTGEGGAFKLQNIRNDSFQIFALTDENISYTYDLPNEKVAFYDSIIHTADSSSQNIILLLFDEEDPVRYVSHKQDIRGLIKVSYKNLPENYSIRTGFPVREYWSEMDGDTLMIWYNAPSIQPDFVVKYGEKADTITYKKPRSEMSALPLTPAFNRTGRVIFNSEDSLRIAFSKPLAIVNEDSITLRDSSQTMISFSTRIKYRQLIIADSFTYDADYTLEIAPGGLTDWFGITNKDTIFINAKTYEKDHFGSIRINLADFDSLNYIMELMLDGRVIRKTFIDEKQIVFSDLSQGKYILRLIEDSNNDERWTPGILSDRKRSERLRYVELDELRKGWDLELDLNIKEIFDGT